ncbi:MAG: response regulator [Deltaproteobacteria bacterium]|nr:response regulator [Deltaproteobacteria bacterium]
MKEKNNIKILLAEDNLVNQKVAYNLLTEEGYDIVIANNGHEVLDLLKKDKFDLILMDIQMPEMSGMEATQAIRQEEQETGKHIPIIAVTAHAMKGDREKCLDAGMDDYISKPVNPRQLYDVIKNFNQGNAKQSATQTQSYDHASVMERVGGDETLMREIVQIFVEESPLLLHEIEGAIHEKDSHKLERSAHSLKGSVSNFSAKKAYDAAYQLEKIGHEGDIETAEEIYKNLEKEIKVLTEELCSHI